MEKLSIPNCPQYVTMDSETDVVCFDLALSLSVPTQALPSLNDVNCADLGGETLCAPAPCQLARVSGKSVNTLQWVEQYENFTLPQFMKWNPFVGTMVEPNEVVCVGYVLFGDPRLPAVNSILINQIIKSSGRHVYTSSGQPSPANPIHHHSKPGRSHRSRDYRQLRALLFRPARGHLLLNRLELHHHF